MIFSLKILAAKWEDYQGLSSIASENVTWYNFCGGQFCNMFKNLKICIEEILILTMVE